MTGLFAVVALILSIIALVIAWGMSGHINDMRIRLEAVAREKKFVSGKTWVALIKPEKGRGKPQPLELEASDESDAMRQLIAMRVSDRIVSLDKKQE